MGLTEFVSASFGYEPETGSTTGNARTRFQWGGTIFALLLLILNRTAQRSSSMTTTLLVFYLFTSLPNALFDIVRGPFGSWASFIAVAANLYLPRTFPVARFVLFVIIPDSITKGLRSTSTGAIFCLVIGVLLAIMKLRFVVRDSESENNCHSICYYICVGFLLYFTITLWQ